MLVLISGQITLQRFVRVRVRVFCFFIFTAENKYTYDRI